VSILENASELRGWFDRVKGDRDNVLNTWKEISEHQLGTRHFDQTWTPGQTRNTRIYDTTAQQAHQLLAGALHGLLTNPATDWFDLDPSNKEVLDDFDSLVWLEDAKRKMLRVFQSQRSGFPTQSAEIYLDLPGYGMAGLSILGTGNDIKFHAHPLSELHVQTGERNQVNTVFREVNLTARQWAKRFPDDNDESVSRALDGKTPDTKFRVIQLLVESDDPFAGPSKVAKAITSVYFSGDGKARILETKGFDEMPLLTPRWSVESGEDYGVGPGHIAQPNARMLNEMMKTVLKYAQKASDPPLLATSEAILSGVRMHPGGITYVQQLFGQAGTGEAIRPIPLAGRHELTVDVLNRVQGQVRNAYFAQLLQLFDQPGMTATQVVQLAQQITQLMAPMLGRSQAELIEPMLSRVFNQMLRGRAFLPVPTALQGMTLNISYVSPVARSQKAADARAVMETWQAAAIIAQTTGSPDALDGLDPDESVRIIAESVQAPRRMLRNPADIDAMRDSREQQTSTDQTLSRLGQGADIAQKLQGALGGQGAVAA